MIKAGCAYHCISTVVTSASVGSATIQRVVQLAVIDAKCAKGSETYLGGGLTGAGFPEEGLGWSAITVPEAAPGEADPVSVAGVLPPEEAPAGAGVPSAALPMLVQPAALAASKLLANSL
jgi:hypothetical protein